MISNERERGRERWMVDRVCVREKEEEREREGERHREQVLVVFKLVSRLKKYRMNGNER